MGRALTKLLVRTRRKAAMKRREAVSSAPMLARKAERVVVVTRMFGDVMRVSRTF